MDHGFDINLSFRWKYEFLGAIDTHPISPLALVLVSGYHDEKTRLAIAEGLKSMGADLAASIYIPNALAAGDYSVFPGKLSLLQYCVCCESAAFVRLLLQHGADPYIRSGQWCLLRLACIRRDERVIQVLLDFGLTVSTGEKAVFHPDSIIKAIGMPALCLLGIERSHMYKSDRDNASTIGPDDSASGYEPLRQLRMKLDADPES